MVPEDEKGRQMAALLNQTSSYLVQRDALDMQERPGVYRMPVSIEKSVRVKRPAKTRTRLGSSLLSIRAVVARRTE